MRDGTNAEVDHGMSRALVGMIFLVACADDLQPVQVPTSPASSVTQNIAYTTNFFYGEAERAQRAESAVVVATPPPPPPTPTVTATATSAVLPLPITIVEPRDLIPVGVASCDRYLKRAEVCTTRILKSPEATQRVVSSLDYTRRAWRRAIAQGGAPMRANLEESCADILHQYERSAAWCSDPP